MAAPGDSRGHATVPVVPVAAGKKNKGSKKNVSSNVRVDGFENTDANL